MAKKGANKEVSVQVLGGESIATEKGRIYRQRTRRGVKIRRFEVVFNPEYGTDHDAIEFLDDLPRGTRSDFARDAILKAIAGERQTMAEQSFTSVIDQLRADNADLRDLLHEALDRLDDLQSREYTVTMEQAQRVTVSTTQPAEVASSGIDMSRPRKRPKRPKLTGAQPAQIEVPDVLTEAESIRLAQQMAASVKAAQPGNRQ